MLHCQSLEAWKVSHCDHNAGDDCGEGEVLEEVPAGEAFQDEEAEAPEGMI